MRTQNLGLAGFVVLLLSSGRRNISNVHIQKSKCEKYSIETAVAQPLVMIVEDDAKLAETIWEFVTLMIPQAEVIRVDQVRKAKLLLSNRNFDLCVAEHHLYDGNSWEIYRQILETEVSTGFLLISAFEIKKAAEDDNWSNPNFYGTVLKTNFASSLAAHLESFAIRYAK